MSERYTGSRLGSIHTDLIAIAMPNTPLEHPFLALRLTLLLRGQCEQNLRVMASAGAIKVAGGLAIDAFPISYYIRLISLIRWIELQAVKQE